MQSAKIYYNSEEFIEKIILHVKAEFPKNAKENALIALMSIRTPGSKQFLKKFVSNESAFAQNYLRDKIETAPIERLQCLLAAGLDVNYRMPDCYFPTPLLYLTCGLKCLDEDHFSRISFLLSWGANPNDLTFDGKNSLMTWILYGSVKKYTPLLRIAQLLIRHKVNLFHKASNNIDVFDLCNQRNSVLHNELADFLRKEMEDQKKRLLKVAESGSK